MTDDEQAQIKERAFEKAAMRIGAELIDLQKEKDELVRLLDAVTEQRDELLEACQDAYKQLSQDDKYIGDPLLAQLYTVIARAEGTE